jgi:hypothetical protein
MDKVRKLNDSEYVKICQLVQKLTWGYTDSMIVS